ncbi:MAG: DUF2270 domain-containing protein [Candidatus Riflebacteria bacterium]|nr:DUF2270 domain-containing protein [Candidatus Riflebacteria bacterium]
MSVWRQRLDVTTNWAMLLAVALTTFSLGSRDVPHFILLLGLAAVLVSIVIEAQRYANLHHILWRLHVIERGYFAAMLRGEDPLHQGEWRDLLAGDLETSRAYIGLFSAIRARLRRNYILLIYFVTAVWITKLFIHPSSPASAVEFYHRFTVAGIIPPWLVVLLAVTIILVSTLLAATGPCTEEIEEFPQGPARQEIP